MDLTLYGICFKMRGGLGLLDYVQSGDPVPIEIMQQVMDQMGTVSEDEMDFAEKMRDNWKKAVNEKVPMLMAVGSDGGYEITCSMSEELLDTVHVLTGLEATKIAEEYTEDYLKNICGIDASIISVDVEDGEEVSVKAEPEQGFSLGDLDEAPEGPAFEDVTAFGEMDAEMGDEPDDTVIVSDPKNEVIPETEPVIEEPVIEEPVIEEPVIEDEPEEEAFDGDEPAFEDGYPEDEIPYEEPVAVEEPEAEPEQEETQSVGDAMAGIYKELVTNIKDKRLDERLGLTIGNEA